MTWTIFQLLVIHIKNILGSHCGPLLWSLPSYYHRTKIQIESRNTAPNLPTSIIFAQCWSHPAPGKTDNESIRPTMTDITESVLCFILILGIGNAENIYNVHVLGFLGIFKRSRPNYRNCYHKNTASCRLLFLRLYSYRFTVGNGIAKVVWW